MRQPTTAQVANYLPRDWRNPISMRTIEEEKEKARFIGGRLPHIAYIKLHLRRRVKFQRDPAVDEVIKLASKQKKFPTEYSKKPSHVLNSVLET